MLAYRWLVLLHVMAAVIWVGALICLGAAVVPAVRQLGLDERPRQQLFRALRPQTRVVGLAALALLVRSGAAMLAPARRDRRGAPGRGRTSFGVLRAKRVRVAALVAAVI